MPGWNPETALSALSPLDGRYSALTAPLRAYFSEAALIRHRIWIEVRYLVALTKFLDREKLTPVEERKLFDWAENLDFQDLKRVKRIEAETKHDVKAVEYFIRDSLKQLSLARCSPWVHWGLTSEDVDNLAYGLMLQKAKDKVLIPAQIGLVRVVLDLAQRYSNLVMLGRTHGQIAVPTTLGKEFVVFASRAAFFLEKMMPLRFGGKLNGAVGNFNAQHQIFPEENWPKFSREFVQGLGLEPTVITTQIEPASRLVYFLDLMRQLNNIWLDLARDCWLYTSLGYLKLRVVETEVGSSTMPHKVNPIHFENAEGNLKLANSLLLLLADKLPLSRLQRDLSDKTIKRNLGMPFGYSLVAVQNLSQGLTRVVPDERLLKDEVQAHPQVLAEAVQLLLKTLGEEEAFEEIQSKVRGEQITWQDVLQGLQEKPRRIIENWRPDRCVGLAEQLTVQEVERIGKVLQIYREAEGDPCPT